MKNLLFKAEDFRIDEKVPSSVGKMKKVTFFDQNETLAWQISDWDWNWSTIRGEFTLEENCEYLFCFWLNGGENDRYDEICNIEIWFGDDWENRTTYKLNRNNFLPTLVKDGWYLFCVPFTTENNPQTTIRFNAMGAYTTIAPSKNPMEYDSVISDEVNEKAPQRPNIVFENGYPEEKKWEVSLLGKKFSTTPDKLKKLAKNIGLCVAVFLSVRGIIKKLKAKKK